MKKELIFGLLLVFVIGGGLFFILNDKKEENKKEVMIKKEDKKLAPEKSSFSVNEVVKHNSKDDCWLIIERKVYDVTSFVEKHPGGKIMLNYCGKEATEAFNTKGGRGFPHKPVARDILSDFYIGDLVDN